MMRKRIFSLELNRQAQPCKASHNPLQGPPSMNAPAVTPSQVRCALLPREEIAAFTF
jgi:hypothetical protein